jgi:CheY-like chemotaxis protein
MKELDSMPSDAAARSEAWRVTVPIPRVLIVEDEVLVAMDLAGVLEQAGYVVTGLAGSVTDALALVRKETFDIALLDVNLGGKTVEPVAKSLATRAIPFGLVTAYPSHILPQSLRWRPCITKPFGTTEVTRLAARLVDEANGKATTKEA